MRLCLVLAFAAFTLSAFAQEKELVSAPTPNLPQHATQHRTFDFRENGTAATLRHTWYWETPDFAQPPLQEINRCLPRGAKINSDDYMPASLRWTLEGKRKVVPVIDLTVVEIKPGEKTTAASAVSWTPSSSSAGTLWTKATHSISELLH
jgi:hypothetical protein